MNLEFFFNYLLQNKTEVIKQALKGELPKSISGALLLVSVVAFGIFGFLIGSSHSLAQGGISMVKLPILFYITGAICFPTLYIFLALLDMRLSFKGIAQFSLICLTIMALILISFAPVSLFFLVTGTHYESFKLLNVAILAIAGLSGVYLFHKYLLYHVDAEDQPLKLRRATLFTRGWLVMFALIGANLGFRLSPIFGDPTQAILLFTHENNHFFGHIIKILFN